jgi:molecular chaperone GrpE (heat shock protein)
LAKATEVVPESELVSNLPLKNLYQGLKMTEKQLQAVSWEFFKIYSFF